MIVRRAETTHEMSPRLRSWAVLFSCIIVVLSAISVRAHSPFDCNARITVTEQSIEATVTVGTDLAAQLIKDSGVTSLPRSGVGTGMILPAELANRFFEIESSGNQINASSVRVLSDGLEALFVVTFPRPTSPDIRLHARFAKQLPASSFSALIVTDDNNQMLGSHIVKLGSETLEFSLPQFPDAVVATTLATNVEPAISSPTIAAITPTDKPQPSFADYFQIGVHHILTGPDHLLFLCGLLVVARKLGGTLAIITCFTLAHSVTLGLAALNIVSISAKIIEPLIAASIIFVGAENFRKGDGVKARCWLAFGFGLIHGFGLAGALRDARLGTTVSSMLTGLLSINLGIELGQLTVAALFLALLWQLRKIKSVERYSTPVLSIIVIALGCWWLVERTFLSYPA